MRAVVARDFGGAARDATTHRRSDGGLMERESLVKVTMRGIERDTEDGHGQVTHMPGIERDAEDGAAGFYQRAGRRAPLAAGRRECCSGTNAPPCSILWTPIHPITWFAPFVGHMGITDSSGRLHDWGGGPIRASPPSEMMFGAPCRYLPFAPKDPAAWDAAIAQADEDYLEHMHCMVCGHDCHSHVAHALDLQEYCGCTWHNKIELAVLMFFCGRHIGVGGAVSTWLGFFIFLGVVLALKFGLPL